MRLGKPLFIALWLGLVALQVWREGKRFSAFRVDHPDAGFGAFLIERGPYYLLIFAIAIGVLALAAWVERMLPVVDADMTEFHEPQGQ